MGEFVDFDEFLRRIQYWIAECGPNVPACCQVYTMLF
jgi:hypothetical protein